MIPGLGRSPGEGNGNPLQYSCLGNPMDRRAWRAIAHGVSKSHFYYFNCYCYYFGLGCYILTSLCGRWGFSSPTLHLHLTAITDTSWCPSSSQYGCITIWTRSVFGVYINKMCVCVCWVAYSHAWLCATLSTVSCQAPLSMEFTRQEYWSVLPCPPPGPLSNPRIKHASLTSPMSPTLSSEYFTTSAIWVSVICHRCASW